VQWVCNGKKIIKMLAEERHRLAGEHIEVRPQYQNYEEFIGDNGVLCVPTKSWYQIMVPCLGVISSEQKGTKSRYQRTPNNVAKQA
jgi:hypothetical protein